MRQVMNFRNPGFDSKRWAPGLAFTVLLGAVLAAASSASVLAASVDEDPFDPRAKKTLERYVEAVGGKAAFDRIRNREVKGTIEVPAQGVKMKVTILAAKPNLTHTVRDIPGMGRFESGCDGKTVWDYSALTGPVIKKGRERDFTIRESRLDRFVYWRDAFAGAKAGGTVDFDGVPCMKILMTPTPLPRSAEDESPDAGTEDEGKEKPYVLYFSKETGLLEGMEAEMRTGPATVKTKIRFKEYVAQNGVKIPRLLEMEMMGMKTLIRTETVKHDLDLPKDRFAPPAEVRKLMAKEAAGKKAPEEGK